MHLIFSRQIQILLQRSKTTTHLLQIYALMLKTALDHDEFALSQFILFASPISIQFSRLIFDNSSITPSPFTWNTIISQYSKSSTPIESIKIFHQLQMVGLKLDKFTYPFVLKACGRSSMVEFGKTVHSLILKMGFDLDKYISNTLLRMYAACNEIGLARQVFDEMGERDVASWSSMIASYINCNCPMDALIIYQDMKLANAVPNSVTMVSLVAACIHLLNTRIGELIHSQILEHGIKLDVVLGTVLVEMYAKWGNIEKAFHIFNSMSEKNLQSWTVMISGLANHGHGEEAICLFSELELHGLKPDSIAFSGILCACSHLGLVEEGERHFDRMVNVYDIKPTMEHYGCMLDMYGRAGMIEEAYQVIRTMPMEPNSVILRNFISSCKQHGRTLCVDENLRKLLLEIEPNLGANYVLASSFSSVSNNWNETNDLRVVMKDKGLRKVPGCSWVEINCSAAKDITAKRNW